MTSTPVNGDPEKGVGLVFEPGHHQHHPHVAKARERLRHFLHPNGMKIHIANDPEEAAHLRRQLQLIHEDHEFDIYISGTPEHLDALREAQSHHEDRAEELRTQHGEIYDRFAEVHEELDALAHELDRVTAHGVQLDAHFNKFGYDAHIRSYDDDDHSPTGSGASTPRSRRHSEKQSIAERGHGMALKLFKTPVVRQYFHNGTLWRASESVEVQSFELFVDLLYVGIIAINGDAASEHPDGFALLKFVITFTLSWKIWNDMAMIISWFETDDIFQRVSILFLLACLFGYTTNITGAFDGTYATLIGFYLAARLYMGSYILLVAFLVPMIRNIMLFHCVILATAVAVWIGSVHVGYPNQLALIWIAIFIDICGQVLYVIVIMTAELFGDKWKIKITKTFEFYPAINIEHRTERMNAFVTLVFGYSVVALLYQSTVNGIDAHYGKAVLGLTQAFCFNWMYFEIDGSNLQTHAIRRHKYTSMLWTMSHLPFIMAYVLGGGALSRLVLAIDTPDSHLDALSKTYREKAEPDIAWGIRWFYCAGFGIALAFMGLISVSHVHKEIEGLRLKKRYRLTGRYVICIILILLPLARGLDSLELVGIVTALIFVALVLELWACSSSNECPWTRSKPCKYVGLCQKKDLQALLKVCLFYVYWNRHLLIMRLGWQTSGYNDVESRSYTEQWFMSGCLNIAKPPAINSPQPFVHWK
jgi:low temperature requirement protein LtrA